MEQLNNNKNLLSFEEYSDLKFGRLYSSFIITKDYDARIEMSLDQGTKRFDVSTDIVHLNEDEINIVMGLLDQLPNLNGLPFDMSEDTYEGYEINYVSGGDYIHIPNDVELKRKATFLRNFIQENHQELSHYTILKLYNTLYDCHHNDFFIGNDTSFEKIKK